MGDKTVMDICRADESGIVSVRLKKFNDDGSFTYHRTTIQPGADAAANMAAVNAHIELMNRDGFSERATFTGVKGSYFDKIEAHALVEDADIAAVVQVCQEAQTVDVVQSYQDQQAAIARKVEAK